MAPAEAAVNAYRAYRRRLFYPKSDVDTPDGVLQGLAGGGPADAATRAHALVGVCARLGGARPRAVELWAGKGTFHAIHKVAFADGRRWVVRSQRVPAEDAPELGFHIDAWAMDMLARAGLPHLRVVAVDTSRCVVPFEYEVMEEAPGRCVADLPAHDERLREALALLGECMARLHEIPAAGYGLLALTTPKPDAPVQARGVHGSWGKYITLNLARHVTQCVDIGAITPAEAAEIDTWFARGSGALEWSSGRLLHGDPGSHNVFADEQAITALIDWEDSLAGDPVYDVAFWATFHPEERWEAYLEGYHRRAPLDETFPARFWLYYLRVALAKTVHRHRFGYTDPPGRLPAATRIQKALRWLPRAWAGEATPCGSY